MNSFKKILQIFCQNFLNQSLNCSLQTRGSSDIPPWKVYFTISEEMNFAKEIYKIWVFLFFVIFFDNKIMIYKWVYKLAWKIYIRCTTSKTFLQVKSITRYRNCQVLRGKVIFRRRVSYNVLMYRKVLKVSFFKAILYLWTEHCFLLINIWIFILDF